MMHSKNIQLLLFFLLINSNGAIAQTFEWSENFEMSSVYNTQSVIQASQEGVYVLHKFKDEQYYVHRKISHYTPDFKVRDSDNQLDVLTYEGNRAIFQHSFTIDKQPYFYFSSNDKNKEREGVFAAPLDYQTLQVSNNSIPLLDLDYKTKKHDLEGYKICQSPNQSKQLFYGKIPYASPKEKGKIGLLVCDQSLKKVAEGTATLPQKVSKFALSDVVDALVDNEGNAYLLFKKYKSKDKKEEKKIGKRFVYGVIKMSNTGSVKVLDTLDILTAADSAMVVSAKLSLNTFTKEVSCIGTYKNPSKKAGLFSCRLNQEAWDKGTKIDYPADVVEAAYVTPKQEQNKKKYGLQQYKIKNIFEQEHGDKIVLAEQHYIKVYLDKSVGRQEIHKLNNILVTKIRKDNTIAWIKILPKRQSGGGVGFSELPNPLYSFFAFEKNEQVYVLYNDLKKNINLEDELALEHLDCNNAAACNLIQVSLDANSGAITAKKALLEFEQERVAVCPQASLVIEDGRLLLLAQKPAKGMKEKAAFRLGWLKW